MNEMLSYCKKLLPSLNFVSDEILENTNEIRLRVNLPIVLYGSYGMHVLSQKEEISFLKMQEIFKKLCESFVYSHENEIKNGFVTVCGGNRVGICGSAVIKNNEITSIKNVSSLNFRLARQYVGISESFEKELKEGGVLILGKAGSGKTTFLRDAARLLSKLGNKVTIIDERNEIAAVNFGASPFDIGFCDVLSSFPKKEGILHAVRTLSPQFIICDEIGQESESKEILQCLYAGSFVTASMHLERIEDVFKRSAIRNLLLTGAFKNVIFLSDFKAKAYKTEELYEAYGGAYDRDLLSFMRCDKSAEAYLQSEIT